MISKRRDLPNQPGLALAGDPGVERQLNVHVRQLLGDRGLYALHALLRFFCHSPDLVQCSVSTVTSSRRAAHRDDFAFGPKKLSYDGRRRLSCSEISARFAFTWRSVARREAKTSITVMHAASSNAMTEPVTRTTLNFQVMASST